MKGIEGVPLQYILTIVVAAVIIAAIVGFMTNISAAVAGMGNSTVVTMNESAHKKLCDAGLQTEQCCQSCQKYGSEYNICKIPNC